jgi:hypothetical protein
MPSREDYLVLRKRQYHFCGQMQARTPFCTPFRIVNTRTVLCQSRSLQTDPASISQRAEEVPYVFGERLRLLHSSVAFPLRKAAYNGYLPDTVIRKCSTAGRASHHRKNPAGMPFAHPYGNADDRPWGRGPRASEFFRSTARKHRLVPAWKLSHKPDAAGWGTDETRRRGGAHAIPRSSKCTYEAAFSSALHICQ